MQLNGTTLKSVLSFCYCKKQIDVSFYTSVLFLMTNFVITLSKLVVDQSVVDLQHFDNVMRKSIISRRTDV